MVGDHESPDDPDRRESAEPPPPKPVEEEDERVDREAEETFPASDPPANY